MKSHEVLREVLEGGNPKVIAAGLGLSVSLVYKWAEPAATGSGAANPLDRIEALIRCTNDQRIVKWLCERAGGFFVPNHEPGKSRSDTVVPATNRVVQEFADMLSVIAAAAVDNDISKIEAEKIRARWEDLKAETEHFVDSCEHGNFHLITGKSRE